MAEHTVQLQQNSAEATINLMEALTDRGLRAIVSFDLQTARAGQVQCGCPYHGSAPCTCQYAVFLVEDPTNASDVTYTIVMHGRDNTVWLTLLDTPSAVASETPLWDMLLSLAESAPIPVSHHH